MYLTIKGFIKTLIFAVVYFLLGSICIVLSFLFNSIGVPASELLIIGIIAYLLGVPMVFSVLYTECKGTLINLGNKLVRKELKPAEFLRHYESMKESNAYIIEKPSIDVLQLVAVAYDLMDEKEKKLAIVDEMIAIASEKKKSYAYLVKCSFLFSCGKIEEADLLFNEVQKQKLDFMSRSLADAIIKSDRAMAMGDYKIVEAYYLNMLECSFPKLDNLGKLIAHYTLGVVYEKLQDNSNAIVHYQYCAEYGGETGIRRSAIERLEDIK